MMMDAISGAANNGENVEEVSITNPCNSIHNSRDTDMHFHSSLEEG